MSPRPPIPRVALLLSTFNGEQYLLDQLESLHRQTHEHWVLYWRDDGSADRTRDVMGDFAQRVGQGRCVEITEPRARLGAAASYHALLVAVAPQLEQPDA
jgi:glycosyltransferase involved in cell wall biosynthesis